MAEIKMFINDVPTILFSFSIGWDLVENGVA